MVRKGTGPCRRCASGRKCVPWIVQGPEAYGPKHTLCIGEMKFFSFGCKKSPSVERGSGAVREAACQRLVAARLSRGYCNTAGV